MAVDYWTRLPSGLRNVTQIAELSDLPSSTVEVDQSAYSVVDLRGQDGNQNGVIADHGTNITEPGLLADAGGVTMVASADIVEVYATASYDLTFGDNNTIQNGEQRVAPVLTLLLNGSPVSVSATGYQRHTNGHNDSSNNLSFIGLWNAGDTYSIRFDRGSGQTGCHADHVRPDGGEDNHAGTGSSLKASVAKKHCD